MKSPEESIKNAVKFLRSIQTLDDIKEHKDDILAVIEDFIKFGVDALKEIIKMSLTPNETKKELDNFQKNQELFNKELEQEMERISNIEGAMEYIDSLKEEMEKRLEPHAQELAELMGEIMNSMMGGFVGSLGDAMNEAFSNEDESESGDKPKIEDKKKNDEESQ